MKRNANWIQQADAALRRAAARARELAEQTNTPLHVMRDGKIVKLMPASEHLVLREDPPPYGGKRKS